MADENEPLENSSISQESQTENRFKCGSAILKRFVLFLFRNYLALGLAFLVIFGVLVPAPGVFLSRFPTHYICIVGLFFHSGIKLRTGEVKEALKAYRALILGIVCILFLTPIVGVKLTSILPFQEENVAFVEAYRNGNNSMNITKEDPTVRSMEYRHGDPILGVAAFRTGIQIYFVVPCTISAGMVMTAQAGGNSALALMLTVICNLSAVFSVPLLVSWLIALKGVSLDPLKLLVKLVLTVLLPLLVGKALRFIPHVKRFVKKYNNALKITSITLLIMIPWMKISQSSADGRFKDIFIGSLFAFLGWGLAVHFLFVIIIFPLCLILKLDKSALKTVVIMASQKSLAVSLTVIAFMPFGEGEQGLITLPMVIIHLGILMIDAFLVARWHMWDSGNAKPLGSDQQGLNHTILVQEESLDETCGKPPGAVHCETVV